MNEPSRILRPTPRRAFELPSADSSTPSTPAVETQITEGVDLLDPKNSDLASKRSGSLLNLTSSTLLGIFQPTAFEDSREEDSPWDTQANTPVKDPHSASLIAEHQSRGRRLTADGQTRSHVPRTASAYYVPLAWKMSLLFACGVTYGTIVAHLDENEWITPVKLGYVRRNSYVYLFAWGVAGVAFAFVLPWLDNLWDKGTTQGGRSKTVEKKQSNKTLAIRGIGAFVGIAFAMRRVPWESATQESLTLALVNPFLWYIIDRTQTGFWLSTVVALVGMALTLSLHPELIPASSSAGLGLRNWRLEYNIQGGISQDATAVAVWLASIFYSACVCFGNIGRQLTSNNPWVPEVQFSDKRR